MIKQKLLFIIMAIAVCGVVRAQETIHRDSLVSDFNYFIDALENTHPDPYSAFGGRVFFQKQAFELKNKLKNNDYTKEEFSSMLSAFVSNMKDGHTNIHTGAKKMDGKEMILPITLYNSGDELFITSLPQDHKDLLGSRLVSINNIPTKDLFEKAGELNPSENAIGKSCHFRKRFVKFDYMQRLMPDVEIQINLEFKKPNGDIQELSLSYLTPEEYENTQLTEVETLSKLPEDYLFYQFLDEKKETMLFHFGSVMSKESFTIMKEGNYSNMEQYMDYYYEKFMKQKRPENVDEAIAKIPAMIELFHNMLVEMKENQSKNLIIDLRDNSGGFTAITLPTLYQLYGDKYLETDMETKFIRMISPLYIKKRGMSLEAYNEKFETNYTFGDYNFKDETADKEISVKEKRDEFIERRSMLSPRVKDFNGKPTYQPKEVIVITNDLTYSAAFHYAFYLWKLGATLVGVPCVQAPNTFMETTAFTLPKTKLNGSISNSLQLFLPPNDRRAKTFYPDYIINWEDYKKYNFNKQTEILYTLDLLKEKRKQTLTAVD